MHPAPPNVGFYAIPCEKRSEGHPLCGSLQVRYFGAGIIRRFESPKVWASSCSETAGHLTKGKIIKMLLNGSQILLECLLEQGVDTVFGYPGGAVLNIYDALYDYSDRITHILTSHEQNAGHAADGYSRSA